MKNDVIFLQGGGSGAYSEDMELVSSLQEKLGSKYNVSYPSVYNEDYPQYESWKQAIESASHASPGKLIYVAHSLGAYFLIKYLTEEKISRELAAICMIAPPYPGGDKNWIFDGFSLLENFGDKLPKDCTIFIYHSSDDDVVPFAHMNMYAHQIPRAITRETAGGHQMGNDLSVVANDIKNL